MKKSVFTSFKETNRRAARTIMRRLIVFLVALFGIVIVILFSAESLVPVTLSSAQQNVVLGLWSGFAGGLVVLLVKKLEIPPFY